MLCCPGKLGTARNGGARDLDKQGDYYYQIKCVGDAGGVGRVIIIEGDGVVVVAMVSRQVGVEWSHRHRRWWGVVAGVGHVNHAGWGWSIIVNDSGGVVATSLSSSMQVGVVVIGHWLCWSS